MEKSRNILKGLFFASEITSRTLRSSSPFQLYMQKPNLEIFRHSIVFSGSSLWNPLSSCSFSHTKSLLFSILNDNTYAIFNNFSFIRSCQSSIKHTRNLLIINGDHTRWLHVQYPYGFSFTEYKHGMFLV